jgi:hypothetical protein
MPRGEVTRIPCADLGCPDKFMYGAFVLTDLNTVLSNKFWDDNGQNIRLIVNCIGERFGSKKICYPTHAAKSQTYYVDCHNRLGLPAQFAKACPAVESCLEQGYDVLVHCRETFHRAPAVYVAFQVQICQQEDYQVFFIHKAFPRGLFKGTWRVLR